MTSFVQQLLADDSGQDLIEYALIASLIGLSAIASLRGLANGVSKAFNGVGNALTNAVA